MNKGTALEDVQERWDGRRWKCESGRDVRK